MNAIKWSYLQQKFDEKEIDTILEKMRVVIKSGAFTLGRSVMEFENRFAEKIWAKHAIAVASGTDAIKLALKAYGIGPGDEVITAANTFIATAGAICELGATPVFVDVTDNFCMDETKIEAAITPKTKAIVPVHLTGQMANMPEILGIGATHGLRIIEDACQCIMGEIAGVPSGNWGHAGAFSLHPLKNLSVWGDGGMIVTNDSELAEKLRLLRNHGLKDRDHVAIMGCNSRLDTIQAVIGLHLLDHIDWITDQRIKNAIYLDKAFSSIPEIKLPLRFNDRKLIYQLYVVFAEERDELLEHLHNQGIDAKVHYPVPCYRQRPFAERYQEGDFSVTDRHADTMISLPAHEHMTIDQLDYIATIIRSFYGR